MRLAEERGDTGTGRLATRRCAVIVDEAHSSQSGDSAIELRGVLGGEALHQRGTEQAEADGEEAIADLYRKMLQRGQQGNISFFAFTATPKHKTLKLFGRDGDPIRQIHDAAGD